MISWFLAMNNHNYARWLPAFLKVLLFSKNHPALHVAFREGLFVVQKTTRRFSAIDLDQAHEQNNAVIKGDGGAIGLLDNPSALKRWMLAEPENAQPLPDFPMHSLFDKERPNLQNHHEEQPYFQKMFLRKAQALREAFEDIGNSFLENGQELFALDIGAVMEKDCVEAVMNVKKSGFCQFEQFVEKRIVHEMQSIYARIPKKQFFPVSST